MAKECLDNCPYITNLRAELLKPPFLFGLLPSPDGISLKIVEKAQLEEALRKSSNCPGPMPIRVVEPSPAHKLIFRCARLDLVQ